MRWLLIALFAVALPIYGQEKSSKPTEHETGTEKTQKPEASQPAPPAIGINVINHETPETQSNRTSNQTKSYLSRLFSPENLPSIGLFVMAGIGIIVAICTLRGINHQAVSLRRQTTILRRSVAVSRK